MNKLISGINEMVKNPSNEIMAMELQLKDGTRLDQRNSQQRNSDDSSRMMQEH